MLPRRQRRLCFLLSLLTSTAVTALAPSQQPQPSPVNFEPRFDHDRSVPLPHRPTDYRVLSAELTSPFFSPDHPSNLLLQKRGGNSNSANESAAELVRGALLSAQRASWEQGVAISALLEYGYAGFSVFAQDGPSYLGSHPPRSYPNQVLQLAYDAVVRQDPSGRLGNNFIDVSTSPTVGSSADPASLGEGVLLGALAFGQLADPSSFWGGGASRQLTWILQTAPRDANGIVSHRADSLQYWSDGVYMIPPFLAAYGLMTNNQSLLQAAYEQVVGYRTYLRIGAGNATGTWSHIWNQSSRTWVDQGAWATGNGWAAAGMLRVLASISQSQFSSKMEAQKTDLQEWIAEIVDSSFSFLDPDTSLLRNYLNGSTTTFLDVSGTALLSYAAMRLASLSPPNSTYVTTSRSPNLASKARQAVVNSISSLGEFFESNPSLNVSVVAALSPGSKGKGSSPESLAFVLLQEAAYRDWKMGNTTGLDGPKTGSKAAALPGALAAHPPHILLALVVALLATVMTAGLAQFNVGRIGP